MFVCLGNICRSPLAEAVFKKMVEEAGLSEHFDIASSGTAAYHVNENADPRTLEVARKHGVRMNHRAQQLKQQHLEDYHYILAMDDSNLNTIHRLDASAKARVMKMRTFDPDHKNSDVPDPYYGGFDGFEQCHSILETSCAGFLEFLKKEHEL